MSGVWKLSNMEKKEITNYCWCGQKLEAGDTPQICSEKYNHRGRCPSCFGINIHEKCCPYYSSITTDDNDWDMESARLVYIGWANTESGKRVEYIYEKVRDLLAQAVADSVKRERTKFEIALGYNCEPEEAQRILRALNALAENKL